MQIIQKLSVIPFACQVIFKGIFKKNKKTKTLLYQLNLHDVFKPSYRSQLYCDLDLVFQKTCTEPKQEFGFRLRHIELT